MRFASWLDGLKPASPSRRGRRAPPPKPPGRKMCVEPLDDRTLPSFLAPGNSPAGANPYAITTAYLNNDAVPDLVVVNNGSSTVSVLLGNGDGTFRPAVDYPTGSGPRSVAVGDFDGDGDRDIATANAGDVSVLLGNGDGTFGGPTGIPLFDASGPQSVAVGDFNADGKMDLGVASSLYNPGFYYTGYSGGYYWQPGYTTGAAHVLVGNGLGGFSDTNSTSLGSGDQWSAAVADFNGDGNQDFAAASPDTWAVGVLAGDGAGTLSGPTNYYTGGPTWAVAAGDVNGDGKPDLVAANGSNGTVGVLLGDALGGFGPAQTYAAGSYPAAVAVADFNHDGTPDVATADYTGDGVAVVLGRGNGTYTPPTRSAAGSYPWGVAAGDFDGDGWADAATANYYGAGASVLLNDHSWTPADAPTVGVGDATVTEGNTGSAAATFTLTLSAAYGQPVTVHYATAAGTATAGDYMTASGDVTIPAGQTSQTFTVAVLGDRLPEETENFYVNLTGAANAFVGDGQGVGTILDNEPRVSVSDVTVTEGNTGSVSATFRVSLSVAYDQPVTVHFATADGSATAGDYAAGSGDVTVAAGLTSQTFTVAVLGDRLPEPTETFLVNLSGPSGNALVTDGQGVGTILDNEPRIGINDVSKKEGNGNGNSTTLFVFTVSLSAAYDQAVTVHFATADGTARVSDNDYLAASGTLTFAPGETAKTITVSVKGDKKKEPNEWFAVNLSGPSGNALVGDAQGIGWILDDDNH
jgi:hypothetical protein